LGGLEIVKEASENANFEADQITYEREKGVRRGSQEAGFKVGRSFREILYRLDWWVWQRQDDIDEGSKEVQHF
jgi:hypothetical protein